MYSASGGVEEENTAGGVSRDMSNFAVRGPVLPRVSCSVLSRVYCSYDGSQCSTRCSALLELGETVGDAPGQEGGVWTKADGP